MFRIGERQGEDVGNDAGICRKTCGDFCAASSPAGSHHREGSVTGRADLLVWIALETECVAMLLLSQHEVPVKKKTCWINDDDWYVDIFFRIIASLHGNLLGEIIATSDYTKCLYNPGLSFDTSNIPPMLSCLEENTNEQHMNQPNSTNV